MQRIFQMKKKTKFKKNKTGTFKIRLYESIVIPRNMKMTFILLKKKGDLCQSKDFTELCKILGQSHGSTNGDGVSWEKRSSPL